MCLTFHSAQKVCLGFCLLMFLTAIRNPAVSQDEQKPLTVSAMKLHLDVLRADARKPLLSLQEKYEKALQGLAESEQKKGHLEAVLAIRKEVGEFKTRTKPGEPSGIEALEKLRSIYHDQVSQLEQKIADQELKIFASASSKMEEAITHYTKAGNIQEAQAVKKLLDETRKEADKVKDWAGNSGGGSANSGSLLRGSREYTILGIGGEYRVEGDANFQEKNGLYYLRSNGNSPTVSSKRDFTPPYKIFARVATDSTNIRIYFGKHGRVIFNWEMSLNELRIVGPAYGKKYGFKKKGDVSPGEMHDIRIEVTDRMTKVTVDGDTRAEIEGDFLPAVGPVRIGPSAGSAITVESLTVTEERKAN